MRGSTRKFLGQLQQIQFVWLVVLANSKLGHFRALLSIFAKNGVCSDEGKKETQRDTPEQDAKCDGDKTCLCSNGVAAMGTACPTNGKEKCVTCAVGFLLTSQHKCKQHAKCKTGMYTVVAGTAKKKPVCHPCPRGKYKAKPSAVSTSTEKCVLHKKCEKGFFTEVPGTATSHQSALSV